jgi:hypothetical protein
MFNVARDRRCEILKEFKFRKSRLSVVLRYYRFVWCIVRVRNRVSVSSCHVGIKLCRSNFSIKTGSFLIILFLNTLP